MKVRTGIDRDYRIYLWPVLRKGLWLGALASFVPSALYGLGTLGMYLTGSGMGVFRSGEYVIPSILACLPFAFTIVPALAGGGLNAVVLYVVCRRRQIRDRIGLVSGAVLGVLWGFIAVGIVWYLNKDSYYSIVDEYAVAITMGVAALVGCWHGWRMARYLQRQTRPEGDIEPS